MNRDLHLKTITSLDRAIEACKSQKPGIALPDIIEARGAIAKDFVETHMQQKAEDAKLQE